MNLKQTIQQDIHNILKNKINYESIVVEIPKDLKLGDYAVPCFGFSKIMRKSPVEIANYIKENLDKDLYEKINVLNGYLNIFVNKIKVSEYIINKIINEGSLFGQNKNGHYKTIVIDYSSPNIAKPFGVGHLRSTVIGNSLKRIALKNGYKVIGINHLGDWGTQFGKLIYSYKTWGDENLVRKNPIDELTKLYVRFHQEVEHNPKLEDKGRYYFKKLEDGDSECLKIWEWFKKESLKEFNKTYELLGITDFESYNGEAFYNDKMESVTQELFSKNLLEFSEGAYVVRLEELPPALIQRSDGATLYITRDLAAAFYRKKNYNFSEALYVVGNEQTLHFTQLKLVLNKMGYNWSEDIHHISFGMVLQDGKKMSTRRGKIVKLHDVLLEAISLAEEYIDERNPSLKNKNEVSRMVGVGAVIFNDLKNYRTSDIEFNLEDILNFVGETGPYIQYTYARIKSLLKHKTNLKFDFNKMEYPIDIWNTIFKLYDFPNVIIKAREDNDPSIIAKYLIELAKAFNKFYGSEKILEENLEKTQFKLDLSLAVSIVLKEGMNLLGIDVPEEM